MNVRRRLALVVALAVAALSLMAGPAAASEAPLAAPAEFAQEEVAAPSADDDHRIPLVDTPRDRFGLLLLGLLLLGGGLGFINARKQLKGERDQASGEFRWR